jgi:arginyl-tRNA synthetase
MHQFEEVIKNIAKDLYDVEISPSISRPEEEHGDFATNVALQLATQTKKMPRQIAEEISAKISETRIYKSVEVAGPGFINVRLADDMIAEMSAQATKFPQRLAGQEVLVEYGDPNPFKEMHIGHLYSYIVGDSISKLFEAQGATVHRLSYHGDVGLHVAKAIWGMKKNMDPESATDIDMGMFYAAGAKAYEADEQAKAEIQVINEQVYSRSDDEINRLYDLGKQKSFEYFKEVLGAFSIKSEKPYLESQSAPIGIDFVNKNIGPVFTQSEGAVVYEGEKVGLHTRVFITSKGLPTYEAKDLGLAELKNQDYPSAAKSIIITASEQSEYFKVMLAALSEFDKPLADKTTHKAHGFVSLSTGKMSSRTGEVYGAVDLLEDVQSVAARIYPNASHQIVLAAVKYGFLKHRLGTDISYDVDESVQMEGNSGPYLQYAHARANGILQKAASEGVVADLEPSERTLARKVSEYPEVVGKATAELMPHYISTYLYELAQTFNRFYENNRVVGSEREKTRLKLVGDYAAVLKHGLNLLNIEAPERV